VFFEELGGRGPSRGKLALSLDPPICLGG
jgi:hypothetical protein